MDDPRTDSWRLRLARGLTGVTLAAVVVGLLPISLLGEGRAEMLSVALATIAVLAAALRLKAPLVVHGALVAGAFYAMGAAGYVLLGAIGGPAVAFSMAVAISGLLFGRRAMLVVVFVVVCTMVAIAAVVVGGLVPPPASANVDPLLARTWLRTNAIVVLFFVILGSVITWVVQEVEGALRRAESEVARRTAAEARAHEAQRREVLGRVAAALAHDVNNNLTVLTMSLPSLDPRTSADVTDAERDEARAAMELAVEQASALTRQLLVLGRRGLYAPKVVSLRALVDAYRPTLRRLLPADIELELVHGAGGEPLVYADESQLHQVLLNLALNARDAMLDRGCLTVMTETRVVDDALAGARGPLAPGRYAVMTVKDTGAGMSDAVRARLFEPFFTTKAPGKGSGLGLATVLAIAEQCEGDLVVETSPERGTAFTLFIPATTRAPVTTSTSEEALAPRPLAGLRVLLAEDSEPVLKVAERVLKDAGCIVTVARDGDEANAHITAKALAFDVLVSDVVMPGLPVRVVIERFSEAYPGKPVLLCSGYVGEELVQRGIEEGRYRLLQKPFTPEMLRREVRAVVDRAVAPTV